MDNFGKSQLLKYGWSEGKGLGKNENGMVQALKPKLKFDTAGIGHSESNDYQWWKFVYNKAANNVDINPEACDITFQKKSKSIEINTKRTSSDGINKEKLLYGNFIKTCKLEDGKIIQNPDSHRFIAPTNEIQLNEDPFVLDDEKLFNACGGRTAHKGARHGIKQSGKLARIEKQEQELVDKVLSLEVDKDWIKVKKKKRKHCSHKMDTDNNDITVISQDETMPLSDSSEIILRNDEGNVIRSVSKKTKLKNKRKVDNLTHQLETKFNFCMDINKNKKNKRKHKNKNSDSDVEVNKKSKKLKKKKSSNNDGEICEKNLTLEVNNELSGDGIESVVEKPKKRTILSASVLNHRIKKKKKQKYLSKEEKKINFLSESLNELIIDKNIQTFNKNNVLKKKKKKKKSAK